MQKKYNWIFFVFILTFILFSSACSNADKEENVESIQIVVDDIESDELTAELDETLDEPNIETSVSEVLIEVEPADEDLVLISDYIPSIYTDLKYATQDNFTKTVIYDFTDTSLRYGTVKKLAAAQDELLAQGYSLKIWDAYRPVSAQFVLWDVYPDSTYVANPHTGSSSHNRGNAVDVTLVNSDGTELLMPTGFDDFSSLADRDYSDISDEATNNALLLENAMTIHGFVGYSKEWWHYSDSVDYPVVTN